MSIESVMPSNHLILCHPLLLLPSIFPNIRVFSNESVLHIRWPEYWSFSFSISLSNEYSETISFRIDWFDVAVQGTLKSSPTPQFKSISSSALSFLHSLTLSSIHDKWKNQLSSFKFWKLMLWKCCTQYASKFGKLSSGHRTGRGQFSFQSQIKAMPKNAQTTAQLQSSHTLVK